MLRHKLIFCLFLLSLTLTYGQDIKENQPCSTQHIQKTKKVRVVFHYVLDNNGKGNFSKKKDEKRINGRKWSKLLVKKANEQLGSLHKNWKSPNNVTQPESAQFKYILKGVKYIKSTELATIDDFTERSSYQINEEYGKKSHKMINVYFHPYYFKGMNNGGGITNRSSRPEEVFIKMYGFVYQKYIEYANDPFVLREEAALLNHEMGHLFGLEHDWELSDGMDDTIPYKERSCLAKKNDYKNCSNNFMSIPQAIPSQKGSFTACQIERIHQLLKGKRSRYVR